MQACKHAVIIAATNAAAQAVCLRRQEAGLGDKASHHWCDQAQPHFTACCGTTEQPPMRGAKLQQSCASQHLLLLTGSVVAVTSSAHQPPNLQFTTQAATNSPAWVPLALEGSWPFDKVVEQALPKMSHQVLKVHILVFHPALNTLCAAAALPVSS